VGQFLKELLYARLSGKVKNRVDETQFVQTMLQQDAWPENDAREES
jgi:hypothetical protein